MFVTSRNQESSKAELSHSRKCHRGEEKWVVMSFDKGFFGLSASVGSVRVHPVLAASPATFPEGKVVDFRCCGGIDRILRQNHTEIYQGCC